MRLCVYLLIAALYDVFGLQLPSYISKCGKNDPDLEKCIMEQANVVIPLIAPRGDEDYQIPSADPLMIEKLEFSPGGGQVTVKTKHVILDDVELKGIQSSAITLHTVMRNLNVSGLANTSVVSVKFNYSDPKHHYDMVFHIPRTEIIGEYTATGKILLLPISGEGDCSINITDIYARFSFDNERSVRADGLEYATPTNPHLHFDVNGGMDIFLSNLFNGNELLADHMNNFLNENWQEVFRELSPTISDSMEKVVMLIMTKIFEKVPLEEAFSN